MRKFKNIKKVYIGMVALFTVIFLCSAAFKINKSIKLGTEPNKPNTENNNQTSQNDISVESLSEEDKSKIKIDSVELESPNPNPTTANIGEEIDVKYKLKISPGETIKENVTKKPIDEVLFLMDLSKRDTNRAQADYFQHIIVNGIVNSTNNPNSLKMKFGVIGMGDTPSTIRGDNESDKYKDAGSDFTNVELLKNDGNNIKDIIERRINKTQSMQSSKLEKADVIASLGKAHEIFNKEPSDTTKAIVLMVNNDFICDNTYKEKLKDLKDNGYKIIIFDASYDSNTKTSAARTNLKKIFDYLDGYDETKNYISAVNKEGGNDPHFNEPNTDGEHVRDSLLDGNAIKLYKLSNLKFNFDLGEGFEPGEEEEKSNNYNLVRDNTIEGNKYTLSIPDVIFKGVVTNNTTNDNEVAEVTYKPIINGTEITNNEVEVPFKVKFKQYTEDNPVVFGTSDTVQNNNFFSYTNVNEEAMTISPIDTPEVNRPIEITHGIYLDKDNIDESTKSFSKGSLVTMAAKINSSGSINLNLTIDEDLELDGRPKVYKINSSNHNLEYISDMNNNTYASSEAGPSDILIIYTVKLNNISNNKDKYTNIIEETNTSESKEASLRMNNNELPDLF